MNTRISLVAVGLAVVVALPASAGAAQASAGRAKATTTVTIKAEGVDLSGKVKSARQACITDRKVTVIKQIGTRGGGDDQRFASDTASSRRRQAHSLSRRSIRATSPARFGDRAGSISRASRSASTSPWPSGMSA